MRRVDANTCEPAIGMASPGHDVDAILAKAKGFFDSFQYELAARFLQRAATLVPTRADVGGGDGAGGSEVTSAEVEAPAWTEDEFDDMIR